MTRSTGIDRRPAVLTLVLSILALLVWLVLPGGPDGFALASIPPFPIELAAVVLVLAAAGLLGRGAVVVRAIVVAGLMALLLVKLADFGMQTALGRSFNFAYDLPLLHAVWMLASGSAGRLAAASGLLIGLAAIVAVTWLAWHLTGAILRSGSRAPLVTAILGLPLALLSGLAADNAALVQSHVDAARSARHEIASLAREAADDDVDMSTPGRLFQAIAGRDVIIVFVESYGRSTLDNPLYAETTKAALTAMETTLADGGLRMRSAFLEAPTVGGQSWLSHASLLSGLWIDSQGRYRALLTSRRPTLMKLASQAGWESVAVMPAITMAWPEGAYFGYDRILARDQLGYQGLPFNWVTMPDQFTLRAFERLALEPADRPPVFAEIALISSHAPWTPIPELVPWEAIGSGTIFNDQASGGEPPAVLWRDHDRVRDHFRRSIDYALRTVGAFAARQAEREPVIVVVGDHQPADFVSGSETDRDVPIHVVADPGTLRLLDDWGWTPAAVPADDAPVWRMDAFRKRFADAFSVPPDRKADRHGPA